MISDIVSTHPEHLPERREGGHTGSGLFLVNSADEYISKYVVFKG